MYRTRRAELRYIKNKNQKGTECPFCNLTNGEIVKKYKNAYLIKNIFRYNIWDRKRVVDHLMFISKEHITSFGKLDKNSGGEYLKTTQTYLEKGYDVFTRATNSGIRTQPHFHTHFIKTTDEPLKMVNFNSDPYFLFFKYMERVETDETIAARDRVLTKQELLDALEDLRNQVVIGLTSGSFDLVHQGHLWYIEDLVRETKKRAAKSSKVPCVIIAINSDQSTRKNRDGRAAGRPVFREDVRAEIIAGINGVDFTFIFDDDWELTEIKPDFIQVFNESDHKPEERPEIVFLKEHSTEIIVIQVENPRPDSTTAIIKRIKDMKVY